ncbi:MAG: RDD family protein, partial [Armatimonadetes bacterium]|nr:RDD family protein [Armatimonadota bacterium]
MPGGFSSAAKGVRLLPLIILVALAYEAYFVAAMGQTPGKSMRGLWVETMGE